MGLIGSRLGGGPAVAARYHAALEDSIARYFPNNAMINCMCHSTENLYRCARMRGNPLLLCSPCSTRVADLDLCKRQFGECAQMGCAGPNCDSA